MLGIRTQDRRKVGADESTELGICDPKDQPFLSYPVIISARNLPSYRDPSTSRPIATFTLRMFLRIWAPPHPSLITSSKAFAFKFYRVVLIQGSSDNFTDMQCYQIGRFIRLRATFQSLWQQLISPNLLHSLKIFVNVSKSLNFSSEIILANFYRHLESFYWSHCWDMSSNTPTSPTSYQWPLLRTIL